jgi:hypothetical protein
MPAEICFAYLKSNGVPVLTYMTVRTLSFADETIVLQHGKLVDKAASMVYIIVLINM